VQGLIWDDDGKTVHINSYESYESYEKGMTGGAISRESVQGSPPEKVVERIVVSPGTLRQAVNVCSV
jgi:hypothetical protein